MYATRFLYLRFLLATVGAAFLVCGAYKIAVQDTRTVTRTLPAPSFTSSSTVRSVEARLKQQAQTVDGQQLGLPAGTKCEAYELADGIVLVCHN